MERIEWDDPFQKESHPNKCLYCHEDEVGRIFDKFSKFYALSDEEIYDIIKNVILYHDRGKLYPDWNFENDITHSDKSVKYYFEKVREQRNLSEKDFLIAFLILRHHGALRPQTDFEEFKDLMNSFAILQRGNLRYKFFQEFSFEKRVNLADAYGLFKIADCLSASGNTSFIPEKSKIDYSDLEKFLPDRKRRSDEEAISEIGRFGFLRAPTGWGKTTASPFYLLNKNINKVFFLFPTITAINKIYERFVELFGNNIEKYFYFYDVEVYGKNYEKIDAQRKIFWSKYFLKPYMITSIDQFLLSFLQTGNYHMRRVMFRNSAIVMDEIHLLNGRMLYLLLHFLKRFWNIYNFHILFMSATFPDSLKEVIENFFSEKISDKNFVDRIKDYQNLRRVAIEKRLDKYIMDSVQEIAEKGKISRVLVICNTVECAVLMKKKIKEYGSSKCILLHARFDYNSRKKLEEEIEKLEKTPHVLVATQVCEVSLDISYDYLYTELAPLPSLIQRFGRVNRGGILAKNINVYIFKPYKKDDKYYPYEVEKIEEARKCLEEIEELQNEYQLIKKLNEIQSLDKIQEEMERAGEDLRLETSFENETKTGHFFALDLSEKEAQEMLSYREDFTTLVIPYGDVIYGEDERVVELKNEIEKLCKEYNEKIKRGNDVERIIAKLKEHAVQAPFYCIRDNLMEDKRIIGLPVVGKVKNFVYHIDYGFINRGLVTENILG